MKFFDASHIETQRQRFLFFWTRSFLGAYVLFWLLYLIMPNNWVFGMVYRMHLYHYSFPSHYIGLVCFFYALFATLFASRFRRVSTPKQISLTLVIILLSLVCSMPFGGMLWHLHDILFGFVPRNWFNKVFVQGPMEGIEIGWFILLLSVPYNVICSVVAFFLTRRGSS